MQLALDYFGLDHVLFGTDAPFAVMPSGADQLVSAAIADLPLNQEQKEKIFQGNLLQFLQA